MLVSLVALHERDGVGVVTHGLQHLSCAVSSSGGVSCWGSNGFGQVMLCVGFEGAVVCCGGGVYGADDCVCFRAGWRRHHDRSRHARGCCWFEQRRSHGSLRRGKITCACCAADACVRAATVCLTDWVVVTWRLDIG